MKKNFFIYMIILCFTLLGCGGNASSAGGGSKVIAGVSQDTITVDGMADDWKDINPLTQEVGGAERDAFSPKIDIHSVKVTWDQNYLYVLLEADHVVSETASIYIDTDGKASTGATIPLVEDKKFDAG